MSFTSRNMLSIDLYCVGGGCHANGADDVSSKVQCLSPLSKRNQKLLVKQSLSEQSLRTKSSTQHKIISSKQSSASVLSRE